MQGELPWIKLWPDRLLTSDNFKSLTLAETGTYTHLLLSARREISMAGLLCYPSGKPRTKIEIAEGIQKKNWEIVARHIDKLHKIGMLEIVKVKFEGRNLKCYRLRKFKELVFGSDKGSLNKSQYESKDSLDLDYNKSSNDDSQKTKSNDANGLEKAYSTLEEDKEEDKDKEEDTITQSNKDDEPSDKNKKKRGKKKQNEYEDTEQDKINYQEIMKYWNQMCEKSGHPRCMRMTNNRREHIRARMKEPLFNKDWKKVIDGIPKSQFLLGKNDRGWKATFDWILMNDSNYAKILEGQYYDSAETGGAGRTRNLGRSFEDAEDEESRKQYEGL